MTFHIIICIYCISQATTEQLRMAHMIDRKSEDASDVRRMVRFDSHAGTVLSGFESTGKRETMASVTRLNGLWQADRQAKVLPGTFGRVTVLY